MSVEQPGRERERGILSIWGVFHRITSLERTNHDICHTTYQLGMTMRKPRGNLVEIPQR